MKNFVQYSLLFVFLLCSSLYSQELKRPESVVFDSQNSRYLVSCVGEHNVKDGKILQIDNEGKPIAILKDNLTDPKGMVIAYGKLYVADLTKIRVYDLQTFDYIDSLEVTGAQFLNDICYDGGGTIYISDNATNSIYVYHLSLGLVSKYCTVEMPNGLYYEKSTSQIFAVSFNGTGNIYVISSKSGSSSVYTTINQKYMDGITKDELGNFYISSWQSKDVIKYDSKFKNPVQILKNLNGPADINFDNINNVLIVPEMEANKVDFISYGVSPDKPINLSPADGSANLSINPTFSWSKSNNSVGYIVNICQDTYFNPSNTISVIINSASDTTLKLIENTLIPKTIYFWYVEAVGETDIISSDTISFATGDAGSVNLFDNNFEIYPNPAIDKIIIKNLNTTEILNCKIYDLNGNIVMNLSNIKEEINTSILPIGIYNLNLQLLNGTQKNIPFIKK